MTIIVCQDCDQTIDYIADEKVSVLYGKCGCCHGAAPEESE